MTDDDIDDELSDLLEDMDVETDELHRLDRSDAEHHIVDGPVDDDVTAVFPEHLTPDDDPRSLDELDSFFDGTTTITEGRLLYDTASQRYCAVRSVDVPDRVVTVGFLRPSDDGRHDTPCGVFEATDETETIEWFVEGGRFLPT